MRGEPINPIWSLNSRFTTLPMTTAASVCSLPDPKSFVNRLTARKRKTKKKNNSHQIGQRFSTATQLAIIHQQSLTARGPGIFINDMSRPPFVQSLPRCCLSYHDHFSGSSLRSQFPMCLLTKGGGGGGERGIWRLR